MKWKIWYDDGFSVSDGDANPEEVPARGVEAITRPDEKVGYKILTGFDYYWWVGDEKQWFGGDNFGLWDYLAQPGWKKVLFGRSMTDEKYEELLEKARNDPDLPEKSARYPDENAPGN